MIFYARIIYLLFNLILSTSILAQGAGYLWNYDGNYAYPNYKYYENYNTAIPTNNAMNHVGEKVDVRVYYECHCPACREVDGRQLVPLVQKIGEHINLRLVPYGKAQTIFKDGKLAFNCQHGPAECYGNKLHACAINELQNTTAAVLFNACLMDNSRTGLGSDDAAVDICGLFFGINSESIKQCANSDSGSWLLKRYGDESKAVGFKNVPHILVNGMKIDGTNVMRDVCRAFRNPPENCREVLSW